MTPLLSCQPVSVSDPLSRYGGTLTRGFHYKPSTINPFFTTQTASASLVQLIFNGLVRTSPDWKIEPDLVSSWSLSEDGRTYTFFLKEGVRFHDGADLTSRDVLFTYQALADPAVDSPFGESFENVDVFRAPDAHTFQVVLKEPSASFIYKMLRYIVPEHLLDGEDLVRSDFFLHPIGTGPFRFGEWTDDGRIILEANPDYYEGRPYLDRIVTKTYSDSRDVWVALMRGEVDCAEFIEREDYEVLNRDPSFKAYAVIVDGYYALRYVLGDFQMSDHRIRRAVAFAVDVQGLINGVEGGYGMAAAGPFWPESPGFDPDIAAFRYDPLRAGDLLAKAGWQDSDGDGILEKGAEELHLNVLFDARNKTYEKIVMALRQQLQEVGIRLNAVAYDDDSLLTREFLIQNKIQAFLTFLLGGLDPDQQAEDWSFGTSEGVRELWGYDDEEVNRLFLLGRVTRDTQGRKKIYQEIGRRIYEEQPACFLYFPSLFHGISARFEGAEKYFNVNMPNYTFKDFFIKEHYQ